MTNHQLITEGFQILRTSLAPYVARELIREYGDADWWRKGVWERLYDYQRRNVPESGSFGELIDSLDAANCLLLIDINWRGVFGNELSRDCLSWVKELRSTRNSWAHFGGKQPTSRDTWRTLDTMSRLCQETDVDAVADIEGLIRRIAPEELLSTDAVSSSADCRPERATEVEVRQPEEAYRQARKFMTKRDWTPEVLARIVDEWCAEHERVIIEGFDELGFLDAAEAALAMPLQSDGEDNSFGKATDNAIFQINDDKMKALTRPRAYDDADHMPSETLLEESSHNDVDFDVSDKDRDIVPEQFEHLPRRKALWDRDEILKVAYAWGCQRGRFLSDQVLRWRIDTLADMVLSKFPEQASPAAAFADASPDTLFAPDSRKLLILTHR